MQHAPRFAADRVVDWQRFVISIFGTRGRVYGQGLGYWLAHEYFYAAVSANQYRRAISRDFWSGFVQFLADEVEAERLTEAEVAARLRFPFHPPDRR